LRLNDALITNQRYRGEPSTDDEGRTQWPPCVLWDDEVPGLGVRIYPPVRGRPSRKDFIVTWKLGLKSRTMAIGTYGVDCTLRQARRAARDALDVARRGQDPIEARQRALGIGTNEDLASRFLFEHSAAKKKAPAGPAPGAPGEPPAEPEAPAPTAPDTASVEGVPPAGVAPVGSDVAESASEVAEPATEVAEPTSEVAAPASEVAAPASEVAAPAPSVPVTAAPDTEEDEAPEQAAPPSPAAGEPPSTLDVPRIDEARRRAASAAATPKRGPTKVRLLPIPDALYRTIEHGARESNMTIAQYLNALIEIARVALGSEVAEAAADVYASSPAAEEEASPPSLKDVLGRVQTVQEVEVARATSGDRDPEHGERGD